MGSHGMDRQMSDISRTSRVAGAYVNHLSAIEPTHGVVAQEDIYNERGILLLKKGTPLKPEMALRLRGHSLQKPVDELISVGRCLNAHQVREDVLQFLAGYPDLQTIHSRTGFDDGLRHLFFVRGLPHLLLQHLTVMKERLPEEYQHTLFTAWFGSLIADEMRMPSQEVYATFIAALFHEIGLLHLEKSFVEQPKSEEEQQDWKYGQHALIAKSSVERTGIYDATVANAVAQHHERCDGTGFPFGLGEEQLGHTGQILAICAALFLMRTHDFERQGKTIGDAIPFLRVNARTYFYPIYKSVYGVLQRAGLQSRDAEFNQTAHTVLLQSTGEMQLILTELVSLSDCLVHEVDQKRAKPLMTLTGSIMDLSRASGLVSEPVIDWLHSMREEEARGCAAELQELTDIHMELLWLVKRAHRKAREVLNEHMASRPDIEEKLAPLLSKLEADLTDAWQILTPQAKTPK